MPSNNVGKCSTRKKQTLVLSFRDCSQNRPRDFPPFIRRPNSLAEFVSAIIVEEADVSACFKHHLHIRLELLGTRMKTSSVWCVDKVHLRYGKGPKWQHFASFSFYVTWTVITAKMWIEVLEKGRERLNRIRNVQTLQVLQNKRETKKSRRR